MRVLAGIGAYLALVSAALWWVERHTTKPRHKHDDGVDKQWDAFAHGDWRWK